MTAVPDPRTSRLMGVPSGRGLEGPGPVRGDPGRAARLFADAERTAQSITDEYWKAGTLCELAEVLAATDPGRAERIARSITGEYEYGACALLAITKALAATDPGPVRAPVSG
jgi:hypothetical protein